MHISVVSLFPDAFRAITEHGITRRAVEKGLIQLDLFNPREFTQDKHRTVDDKPYGGGPGMLMKVQPLRDAIQSASRQATGKPRVIYLSPQGRTLRQEDLQEFAQQPELILVAGRYEGIDERLIESMVDEEVSIGDFVLSGGELPAMVLIDGITRLLPGAVGDAESVEQESFAHGLLDYPHYTRPEEVDGLSVPGVLMSGDHQQIERWRKMQAIGRTYERRPDLLAQRTLSHEENELLDEYLATARSEGN